MEERRNGRNMREEIKVREELTIGEVQQKAISCRIREYEHARYFNILKEIRLVKDILENIGEEEEVKNKYTDLLDSLYKERKGLEQKWREEEEEEKDSL